ncbi:hypothetical protein [uncultured Amnibacterium sp.]|uniref:hypothetical protein n=1 Tax=uncultured Amnibacterium sp. TaxID=1631851 RepID=UPI0035CC68A1
MSTSTVARPASPADVVALQYANPTRMVTIPIGIIVAVVVVMTCVTFAVVDAGGRSSDLDYNGAVIWSLFGFVVATGVQAVTAAFPLALALGTTRRTFALGVLTTQLLQSVLLAAVALVLLGLEGVSGGWFVGARVLGDATLGGGNPGVLIVTMLLASLSALAAGGLFGAAFVRFGSRGPAVLGIVLAAVVTLVLLLALPPILAALTAFQPWWLVVAALLVVALGTSGQYALLRGASVR